MGLMEKVDIKMLAILFLLAALLVVIFQDSVTEKLSPRTSADEGTVRPWETSNKPIEEAAVITGRGAAADSGFVNPYAGRNSTCPPPQKLINDECCADANGNGACDRYEQFCGDGVCSADENECTCAQDCGACESKAPTGLCQQFSCQNDQCVEQRDPICCGDLICSAQESCSGCFVDCCSLNPARASLATYPKWAEGMDTVLGDTSNSINVITAADILTHIALKGLDAGEGKLASEVDLRRRDTIVIGNPCTNPALVPLLADRIYAKQGNCQVFAPGEAILKIVPTSNQFVALVVAGFAPRDAQRAARVLLNYSNYNLDGREFSVGGTHPQPTATKVR